MSKVFGKFGANSKPENKNSIEKHEEENQRLGATNVEKEPNGEGCPIHSFEVGEPSKAALDNQKEVKELGLTALKEDHKHVQ